jgi:hypothetical protein
MHSQDILVRGLFNRHPFTLFQKMLCPHFPINVKQPSWILGMDLKDVQCGVIGHVDIVNVAGKEMMALFGGRRCLVQDAF